LSTNFYLVIPEVKTPLGDDVRFDDEHPSVHVGLRTSRTFIWAQDSGRLREYGEAHPDEKFIRSEYHETFTWREFFVETVEHSEQIFTSIGQRFF
jgi:hypothetical protein